MMTMLLLKLRLQSRGRQQRRMLQQEAVQRRYSSQFQCQRLLLSRTARTAPEEEPNSNGEVRSKQ
jgi:hypothetical protein